MSETTASRLRVAVPSEAPGGLTARRSGHFGRCDCFTVAEVEGGRVVAVEVIENPPHQVGGCMRPVLMLAENTVDALVVDGIGGRPLLGFNQVGIAVHAGIGVDVQTAVTAYTKGSLPEVGLESACRH
jgi:predicted Fe-Mo cluster-binding NifX family protein